MARVQAAELAKSAVAVSQLCYSPSAGRDGMVDVARWLADQGLGHHSEAFAENGIAADILR